MPRDRTLSGQTSPLLPPPLIRMTRSKSDKPHSPSATQLPDIKAIRTCRMPKTTDRRHLDYQTNPPSLSFRPSSTLRDNTPSAPPVTTLSPFIINSLRRKQQLCATCQLYISRRPIYRMRFRTSIEVTSPQNVEKEIAGIKSLLSQLITNMTGTGLLQRAEH